ncbi:SDR family NAD(P)-dependent oxidoreductase [Pseudomonas marginalis]|uniref:SDR family NAD(P)-dependent oxidoreductase n=1 Tax=Pseudomonas marginalis TaxID=298 RepID=A0A9X9BKU5_PSEMA|nr:SDR family NAD(P)-dependent oxidoreductase [Pseudomonas marginalis]TWR50638.1 SDR family NAD(P)-dependent oxidoreductase [Pseudomonas marginalis]
MASAQRLLAEGWRVQGLSRRAAGIDHPRFHWIECDLSDLQALDQALQPIETVDAIVHAAGFMRTAPLGQLQPQDGQAMWQVHVAAASHLVNTLHPGARIVMIGSRTMQGVVKRPARGL